MAQLDFDTLLLLDSFGTLREQVNTGDQIFVNSGQLSKLYILLDRNQLSYESASYRDYIRPCSPYIRIAHKNNIITP